MAARAIAKRMGPVSGVTHSTLFESYAAIPDDSTAVTGGIAGVTQIEEAWTQLVASGSE
jgi:hypothetical protein